MTDIPTCLDRETLARLESAYRELYLNEESGAFPFESAWCGDAASGERNAIDGIYAWQRRSGFVDEVGSYRCADHLVGQLRLLAHLVSPAGASMPFADIGLFLDQHLFVLGGAFCRQGKSDQHDSLVSGDCCVDGCLYRRPAGAGRSTERPGVSPIAVAGVGDGVRS